VRSTPRGSSERGSRGDRSLERRDADDANSRDDADDSNPPVHAGGRYDTGLKVGGCRRSADGEQDGEPRAALRLRLGADPSAGALDDPLG
jgi:hypothetical protein